MSSALIDRYNYAAFEIDAQHELDLPEQYGAHL